VWQGSVDAADGAGDVVGDTIDFVGGGTADTIRGAGDAFGGLI